MKMRYLICFLTLFTTLTVAGETVLQLPFDRETPEVKGKVTMVTLPEGGKALRIDSETNNTISIVLPAEKLAGRRVTLTCEVKRDIPEVFTRWQGGKLMLVYADGEGKLDYPARYMPPGSADWETMTVTADLPLAVRNPRITLGIQSGKGSIFYRNLRVEAGDVIIPLTAAANMGLRDEVARDGKGGWTDEGKSNDAAGFRFKADEFGGIPFRVLDPAKNNEKAVITFKSAKFPAGPEEAAVDLRAGKVSGKWLYLLHTITQCKNGTPFGDVEVTGVNGKKAQFELEAGRDAGNWWNPTRLPNAIPGATWSNGSSLVGVYVSRFRLPEGMGDLAELRFKSRNSPATWIVSAATLSETEYSFADAKEKVVTIEAGERWKVLPLPKEAGIRPGSALDRSSLFPRTESGKLGWVKVDEGGHIYFEKRPGERVRFLANALTTDPYWGRGKIPAEFTDKKRIEAYADELVKRGYNMVRFHFIDAVLLRGAKEDYQFNAEALEQFDYLISCLKKRGFYFNIDVMSSRIGYAAGKPWTHDPKVDKRNFKQDIHFNEAVRRNWAEGMKKFYQHVNPYTGLRLVDDPAFVMTVCFNEQEFAFFNRGRDDYEIAQPRFQAFLLRRYGSDEELAKAWGTPGAVRKTARFTGEEIGQSSAKGKDIARFIAEVEEEMAAFYVAMLREAGFRGLITNYNMGKSLHYMSVRDGFDYVAMNGYHAHPFGNTIDPGSSVGAAARLLRNFASTRRYGKPFAVTEHLHSFWNPYRYEQGLVTGGYAALQDFDALTVYTHTVSTYPEPQTARPFAVRYDPIAGASEFLTAYLYGRGDVKPAGLHFRLWFDRQALYAGGASDEALDTEESMLALVGGLGTEGKKPVQVEKNEVVLPAFGGSRMSFVLAGGAGAVQSVDGKSASNFRFDREIAELKEKGLLPKGNSSNYEAGRFESATGELLLESRKNFMTVKTSRFRGFTGEAGQAAELPGFSAKLGETRGCLAAVTVDEAKSLEESGRIVVVFTTNLLNSGMRFEDETFRVRLGDGKLPWLVETGGFRLTLSNRNAAGLKAYALGLDGARVAELPLTRGKDKVTLEVDTAKLPNGPALYFEIVKE